jgi:hypothetical protein
MVHLKVVGGDKKVSGGISPKQAVGSLEFMPCHAMQCIICGNIRWNEVLRFALMRNLRLCMGGNLCYATLLGALFASSS